MAASAPTTIATDRPALIALVIGVVGLGLGLLLAWGSPDLPAAVLMGFVFWTGLSLGGLAILLINHMAGGSWGAVVRRPLEAMVSALPVALLFLLPVIFFIPQLYPWADAEYVATHPLVAWKSGYLNTTWYIIRAVLYGGLWLATAWFYLRGARDQDAAPLGQAGRIGYRLKNTAALWFVLHVLAMTVATLDWTMSLTPEWWSGVYGAIFLISQAIAAMAVVILTMVWMAGRSPRVDGLLTWKRLQDLANLMMGFTMFWAYLNVGQLMIQWSNNIVETNTFYVLRFEVEPWRSISIYLLALGYALPFFILLSRWVKRTRLALSLMSVWIIFNHMVHLYWYVAPGAGQQSLPSLGTVAVFLGLGGLWFAAYLRSLGSRSVVPEQDPRLLAAEHGHQHTAHDGHGHARTEARHA